MNTLKTLKLALLVTSVMLFPKGGYAMGDEDNGELRASFCNVLPASSSNQLQAISPDESLSDSSGSTSDPSSSTSAPAVKSALELGANEFHMEKSNGYSTTGFSDFEGIRRWIVGKKAIITVPLESLEHRPTSISFLNTGGLVTAHYSQNLIVKVNGMVIDIANYTLSDNNKRIDVLLPKAGPAEIEFETPNAISSYELGIGTDKRDLGISIGEVQFSFE